MPGCLGMDGLWQLVGFYLGMVHGPQRAISAAASLGTDSTFAKLVTSLDIKRLIMRSSLSALPTDAFFVMVSVFEATDIRVGR